MLLQNLFVLFSINGAFKDVQVTHALRFADAATNCVLTKVFQGVPEPM